MVIALAIAGSPDEVMAAADGLIRHRRGDPNPYAISFALLAYGFAFRNADPDRAREAMRRGVVIAHDSGNRYNETHLTVTLALLEAKFGDPLAALEYSAVAIRNLHDAVTPLICVPRCRCSQYFSIGSHAMNRRRPSPVSCPIP